jgi:lysophospholipase L1-like esterase
MSKYAVKLKKPASSEAIGHVHKPNSSAHLMNVDVSINSDGLRDTEYPVERNKSYRMAFLGDSLTFGWGVEKKHTFEHRLEEILNRQQPTEILNFGTGNYNTSQEVNLFLEKGLKYQPDKVVLFYFINDAEPTPKKSKWSVLENSQIITFYWSKIHAVKSRWFSKGSFQSYYSALYDDNQPGWQKTKEAFLLLKETCKKENMKLQIVLLPELHNVENYPFTKEYEKVSRFLSDNAIESKNILPAFKGEKDPVKLWVSLDDAHPNHIAHSIIADSVADFIAPGKGEKIHDQASKL